MTIPCLLGQVQQWSATAVREIETSQNPTWTRTTDRMDRQVLWHPSGIQKDSGKEPGLPKAFWYVGLIENQLSIIYCPQRKGVLLLLPCIQILFQPWFWSFCFTKLILSLPWVIILSEIISKCHILSTIQEHCDQLYWPYSMPALKQTIQPLLPKFHPCLW